ncbi:MAG: fatty acid desaturase [Bacteroidetes bacterium]|nr:fatty acid desaturase [Bacteroidota bacterium]MBS1649374.1 fatty acid desaturase [Bacteroidota bacterium]
MLCGKQLILATKPYAKECVRTSWMHLIATLLLLLFCFTGTLFVSNIWLRILSAILAGLIVIRFFIIYHDFEHYTILHKSKIAKVIMTVFGVYMMAAPSIWKRSHDYHHKHNSKLYTADIGSFPIVTANKFLTMPQNERRLYLAIRHPLTILFGYITMFMLGMSLRSFLSSPKKHWDSLVALIMHAIGSIVIFYFFGWIGWLLCAVTPLFIACAIGSYLFYAQHNFPGVFFNDKDGWTYEAAALQSSSYMKMNKVMEWFTGNIGYHHIHHLNARIPFYKLPAVMEAFPELQQAKTTSLKIKDIIACFKLKVWDVENKKMISLKEVYLRVPTV